jgi:hypothetical protein
MAWPACLPVHAAGDCLHCCLPAWQCLQLAGFPVLRLLLGCCILMPFAAPRFCRLLVYCLCRRHPLYLPPAFAPHHLCPASATAPAPSLQEDQRELAKTIRVSGSILLSTVSNFLDFFKIGAPRCAACLYWRANAVQ